LIIKLGLLLYDLYSQRFSQQRAHPLILNPRFQLKNASLKQFPELDPNIVARAIYYDAVML